eukprot:CAMPEP_0195619004 /NCGR_PEP_ID=MMETSP0815-20121206/14378_1 /TAXON_ID=97485 /ORGANISM="Prymnesium parvum, Strain Texoma1" /LENGTH=189 /DNA_ID=CAMNT_0040759565 /DNA_START=108 /DNA_END=678 /DNA_ORIENTATION=+
MSLRHAECSLMLELFVGLGRVHLKPVLVQDLHDWIRIATENHPVTLARMLEEMLRLSELLARLELGILLCSNEQSLKRTGRTLTLEADTTPEARSLRRASQSADSAITGTGLFVPKRRLRRPVPLGAGAWAPASATPAPRGSGASGARCHAALGASGAQCQPVPAALRASSAQCLRHYAPPVPSASQCH